MVSVKKSKKGVTLAELTVVMAIVAIMSTCVVSFTILINSHVGRITREQDIQTDLDFIKLGVDRWFSFFDSADYQISFGTDHSVVATPVNPDPQVAPEAEPVTYTLSFSEADRTFTGELANGNSFSFPLTAVRSVYYYPATREGVSGVLLQCHVNYEKIASITGVPITKSWTTYKYVRAAVKTPYGGGAA